MFETVDVLILGAGAAGLMCAIEAGKLNRSVVVLDHSDRPGKKLLVTGGGRCNFTNRNVTAGHYLSHNPHFCKSAPRGVDTHIVTHRPRRHFPRHEVVDGVPADYVESLYWLLYRKGLRRLEAMVRLAVLVAYLVGRRKVETCQLNEGRRDAARGTNFEYQASIDDDRG